MVKNKEKTNFLKETMDKLDTMRTYRKHKEHFKKGILILSSHTCK